MLRTLAEESFKTYLEASDRYSEAVEHLYRTHHLGSLRRHQEFLVTAEEVRKLRVKAEEAYTAMINARLEASTQSEDSTRH